MQKILMFLTYILLAITPAWGVDSVDMVPNDTAVDSVSLQTTQPELEGVCVKVVDGDTIDVRAAGGVVRFRLHGVDAPEKGQPFSRKATTFVRERVDGKPVRIVYTRNGKAAWKRGEGVVFYDGDRCLNRELVAAGLAVIDPLYCESAYSLDWGEEERKARQERVGFWSQKEPVYPWEKREADRFGDATAREARSAVDTPYLGNGKRQVFHAAACPSSLAKNCTPPFATRDEAIDAGFRPCQRCRP